MDIIRSLLGLQGLNHVFSSFLSLLGELMISVLDPKREVGLWHSVLTVSAVTLKCNFSDLF